MFSIFSYKRQFRELQVRFDELAREMETLRGEKVALEEKVAQLQKDKIVLKLPDLPEFLKSLREQQVPSYVEPRASSYSFRSSGSSDAAQC